MVRGGGSTKKDDGTAFPYSTRGLRGKESRVSQEHTDVKDVLYLDNVGRIGNRA